MEIRWYTPLPCREMPPLLEILCQNLRPHRTLGYFLSRVYQLVTLFHH